MEFVIGRHQNWNHYELESYSLVYILGLLFAVRRIQCRQIKMKLKDWLEGFKVRNDVVWTNMVQ